MKTNLLPLLTFLFYISGSSPLLGQSEIRGYDLVRGSDHWRGDAVVFRLKKGHVMRPEGRWTQAAKFQYIQVVEGELVAAGKIPKRGSVDINDIELATSEFIPKDKEWHRCAVYGPYESDLTFTIFTWSTYNEGKKVKNQRFGKHFGPNRLKGKRLKKKESGGWTSDEYLAKDHARYNDDKYDDLQLKIWYKKAKKK